MLDVDRLDPGEELYRPDEDEIKEKIPVRVAGPAVP
jgi:hypothetical protein